jgi:hypothetical protein
MIHAGAYTLKDGEKVDRVYETDQKMYEAMWPSRRKFGK